MADHPELSALPRRRSFVDSLTRVIVALGGAGVIAAIALIFVYLLWVVIPIFAPTSVEEGAPHAIDAVDVRWLDTNDSGDVGMAVDGDGTLRFFPLKDDFVLAVNRLSLGQDIATVKPLVPLANLYAVANSDGDMTIVTIDYQVSFEAGQRQIKPVISYPFEDEPIALGEYRDFEVWFRESDLIVAVLGDNGVRLKHFEDVEDGMPLEDSRSGRIGGIETFEHLYFGPDGRWLYLVARDGRMDLFDIRNPARARHVHSQRLVRDDGSIAASAPLLGRYSLLVAEGSKVTQWVFKRDEAGYAMRAIRDFDFPASVVSILPEYRRKGFVAVDAAGTAHFAFTTSGKILAEQALPDGYTLTGLSPRARTLLAATEKGVIDTFEVTNEHPDISWRTMWGKVWYEGYPEPIYSWQSSSGGNDFEAKFSLMPLLFGTLKAAFYAMLVATPLAIMGAMYTAYFMAPRMRRLVKPGIEVMAALPTVVLGFLAGLWLAPLIEENLPALLGILVFLPAGLMLLAWAWSLLPDRITRPCNGWYGLLAMIPIVLMVWLAFVMGPVLEDTFFGGSMRAWMLAEWGIRYDQRNALVVGLAMGLAVVPTIFSIAEDAIYGVPRHLINGSLALGATPWQTLIRVVLLTASPGLFSAVMIGFGRAVGETMIVLMATGNTPVMDWSIFEGMRTFAANIAVELPEAEVDSSHFRILFLTALVLFMITFIVNSAAEIVRQRLRARYGSL